MTYSNGIWRWHIGICAALGMLIVLGCRGPEAPSATGPAGPRTGGNGWFEIRFETRGLLPHPGRRALCECDAAGTLRVSRRGREDVTLQLGPEAVASLAVAAEAYVGRPGPFAKLDALDGHLITLYVRSGKTVRVSVTRNWRMPPEGRALMDAVRKAAAGARPTDKQARTIEAAADLLLGADFPDEDWDGVRRPPWRVISNDDPARLVELLEKDRPPGLDESEAWFLRDVLLEQVSGTREAEGL